MRIERHIAALEQQGHDTNERIQAIDRAARDLLAMFEALLKALTGDSTERVDTGVLQVFFRVENDSLPLFVGQQMDVFIQAPPAVLSQIKCVEYTLHPTFPNPVRQVCDRGQP